MLIGGWTGLSMEIIFSIATGVDLLVLGTIVLGYMLIGCIIAGILSSKVNDAWKNGAGAIIPMYIFDLMFFLSEGYSYVPISPVEVIIEAFLVYISVGAIGGFIGGKLKRTPIFCPKCGKEIKEDESGLCKSCGSDFRNISVKKPSNSWYLLPIFFNTFGGVLGFFFIRNKDEKMAKNVLSIGLVVALLVSPLFFYPLPETIELDVQTPSIVVKDQVFNITISIKNTDSEIKKLKMVVIPDKYLEGIEVISSDPKYTNTAHGFSEQYYYYYIDIIAQGEQKINFTVKSVETGEFSGEIWAGIRPNFPGKIVSTVVELE